MKGRFLTGAVVGLCLVLVAATSALAQGQPDSYIVSLYRVPSGDNLEFLEWLAEHDRIVVANGGQAARVYSHGDGDGWDYLTISPLTTDEREKALAEAAAESMPQGGFAGNLRFHEIMSGVAAPSASGGATAAELMKAAHQKGATRPYF